jgi:hypothetical protein
MTSDGLMNVQKRDSCNCFVGSALTPLLGYRAGGVTPYETGVSGVSSDDDERAARLAGVTPDPRSSLHYLCFLLLKVKNSLKNTHKP